MILSLCRVILSLASWPANLRITLISTQAIRARMEAMETQQTPASLPKLDEVSSRIMALKQQQALQVGPSQIQGWLA